MLSLSVVVVDADILASPKRAMQLIHGAKSRAEAAAGVCNGYSCPFEEQLSLQSVVQNLAAPALPSTHLSQECLLDVVVIFGALERQFSTLKENHTFASMTDVDTKIVLPMLDASGKIGAGILRGRLVFEGMIEECQAVDQPVQGRSRNIKGDYFRFFIDPAFRPSNSPDACGLGVNADFYPAIDLCLPASCTSQELAAELVANNHSLLNVSLPICSVTNVNDILLEKNAGYYIVVVFMSMVAIICVASGLFDYFLTPHLKGNPITKTLPYQLFMAFSVYRNVQGIFDVSGANKEGQINVIHCIRVFSMCWVITGHTFSISIIAMANALDAYTILPDLTTEFLTNAYFSVDSFFFISGMLLSFIWMKNFNKSRRQTMSWQSWIMFYVHRVLRLSPPYYVAVAFFAFVIFHLLSDMPNMIYSSPFANPCTKSWYTNFLYLNNYVDDDEPCYGIGWYLASEMQMYLFTPILLIPLGIAPMLGFAVSGVVLILSTAANIFTVYHYHFAPTALNFGPKDPEMTTSDASKYSILIYDAPYIRCQIYVIGLLVGWLLQQKKRLRIPKVVNIIGWIIFPALMLTVALGLHNYTSGTYLPVFWRAMYSALSRPSWGLGLSWIVISCYYGYGGPVNDFMSWYIWVPLSRLTYCGFLIHIPVLAYFTGASKTHLIWSSFTELFVTRCIPYIVISIILSVPYSAFFEISVGKVEMLLLGGFRSGGDRRKVAPAEIQDETKDAEFGHQEKTNVVARNGMYPAENKANGEPWSSDKF